MVCLGLKLGPAGWKAQMNYAAPNFDSFYCLLNYCLWGIDCIILDMNYETLSVHNYSLQPHIHYYKNARVRHRDCTECKGHLY